MKVFWGWEFVQSLRVKIRRKMFGIPILSKFGIFCSNLVISPHFSIGSVPGKIWQPWFEGEN
jgi:hypothetical protein